MELGALQQQGFDLALTGFSAAQIKRLLPRELAPDVNGVESQFQVVVECRSEAQQVRLLKKLHKEGLVCRALVA